MKPYKTKPVFKEKVWGGEWWHTDMIQNEVPVLIKFIKAQDMLSVQVHPDDEYAARIEKAPRGKDELWVILECEEGSEIIYGFRRKVEKDELMEHLLKGSVEEMLNRVKVRAGDCIFIPAGTVHSLGGGIRLLEIQQPSELTYRLYDWDRTDSGGSRRELHIEKALQAINYSNKSPEIKNIYDSSDGNMFNIIHCEHFSSIFRPIKCGDTVNYEREGFRAVTLIEGRGLMKFDKVYIPLKKGDTVIIPEDFEGKVSMECLEAIECIETVCGY